MNKPKKIISAVVIAATIGTLSVGAYAAGGSPYNFFFDLEGKGDEDWSPVVEKNNNKTYAEVYVQNGYVSDSYPMYITINKEPGYGSDNILSSTIMVNQTNTYYSIQYTTPRGQGSSCCLHGRCGYYGSEAAGNWTP